MLHYKLDTYNLFNPNTLTQNIYLLSNGNTSTSGAAGYWALTEYIPVKPNTTYIGYNLVNGGNGNPSICYYDINKTYTRGTAITPNTPLNITTQNNEYYVRISIRKANNDIYKMLFLEIPKIIEDSSGYNHNGTINGNIQIASNSSRYNNCIYSVDGGSNYIQTPTLNMPTDAVTLNIWFKSLNKTPASDHHMIVDSVGNSSGRQHYEMAVHKTGYFRGGLFVNGARKADNCTTTTGCDGNWHMLTLSYDGTAVKRYFDGIMEKSTAAAITTGLQSSTTLRLFKDGYSSYACREASLSDFRIYCTALNADDVLALYHTGAKIDNKQNLHAFELAENNSKIQINKYGQTLCNELEEDATTKFYKTNQIIETNEIIEL